jgi:uncharacterized protein (TIGR03086 family)
VVICAGAVEIAVHGWDVRAVRGRPQPVPSALAEALLRLVPPLVADGAREGLFGEPVPVPASAPAGDRLVGFLGRCPQRPVGGRWPGGSCPGYSENGT